MPRSFPPGLILPRRSGTIEIFPSSVLNFARTLSDLALLVESVKNEELIKVAHGIVSFPIRHCHYIPLNFVFFFNSAENLKKDINCVFSKIGFNFFLCSYNEAPLFLLAGGTAGNGAKIYG